MHPDPWMAVAGLTGLSSAAVGWGWRGRRGVAGPSPPPPAPPQEPHVPCRNRDDVWERAWAPFEVGQTRGPRCRTLVLMVRGWPDARADDRPLDSDTPVPYPSRPQQ